MRVATKIVALAGTLIVLLTAVLALHVWWVQRLAQATARLPTTIFRVGSAQLELDRGVHDLIEFSRKAALLPDWEAGLRSVRAGVQKELRDFSLFELAPSERIALARVQVEWQRYLALPPLLIAGDPAVADPTTLEAHLAQLRVLRSRLGKLTNATSDHLATRRREAQRTVSLTKRLAWAIVGGVLLLAVPLLWWTIRSIHRPLRRLTAGTRDVAAGRFALQLDASSGDELAEVAESFNRMVQRLRELDELKRDFLSHVSHELNTPLVAMRETNELLLDGLAGPLSTEQSRMLELNRDGAIRLSRMIGKVLDLSRLEAGAMEYDFTAVELNELVARVADEFAAAAQERDIAIELSLAADEVVANCDRDRMLQVLENLLSNALKFAPSKSVVRMTVEAPRRSHLLSGRLHGRANRATITVSDRGPGVAEEERETIFERFHRGDRHGSHGFGLGLAISREITEAHGGRLWVRDNPPGGSVFGVELSATATSKARRSAAGGPS